MYGGWLWNSLPPPLCCSKATQGPRLALPGKLLLKQLHLELVFNSAFKFDGTA